MRTTLDIDDDVLAAAKALARRERKSAGAVLSELARRGLHASTAVRATQVAETRPFYGFDPLPARGVVVTDALIDRLREDAGD
ncbi:MAG TPA: hypothetical protein PKZ76_09375 [Xanthomonadaceae bacterium]|nr:hypothetical protein [Xanthomonadaceae bacterium]